MQSDAIYVFNFCFLQFLFLKFNNAVTCTTKEYTISDASDIDKMINDASLGHKTKL